jgi:hypothetical protein
LATGESAAKKRGAARHKAFKRAMRSLGGQYVTWVEGYLQWISEPSKESK